MYKRDLQKHFLLFLSIAFLAVACIPVSVDITPSLDALASTSFSPPSAKSTPSITVYSTPISSNNTEFQCIASFETYAFSAIHWEDHFSTGRILPLPPWQHESPLPEFVAKSEIHYLRGNLEGTRNIESRDEIWVSRFVWELSSRMTNQLFVFRSATEEWEHISREVQGTGETVEEIWIAEDNTVWGLTLANHTTFQNTSRFISKFNDATRRFEYVGGIRGVFLSNQRMVFDEKESIFWFFTPNDAIYRYDPNKQEVIEIADLGDINVISAVMSPNGTFYFRQPFYDPALRNDELYQFSLETGKIIPIEIPDEPFPSAPLFVDKKENLWLGAFGWRDPNGIWGFLDPNPQDYFDSAKSHPKWNTVRALLESSNGYMWFNSELGRQSDGIAWVDPRTGEGCWFTTEPASVILEDDNQVLWIVLDDSLYSLDLGEILTSVNLFP